MRDFETNLKTVSLLKAVSYFSTLDDATIHQLSQSAIQHGFHAGQVVLLEGEPCADLFIVESGWLKVVKIGLDGREQVLQIVDQSPYDGGDVHYVPANMRTVEESGQEPGGRVSDPTLQDEDGEE